ncbi:MAG: group-specific protein [Erysipelotrichaceae bacterium]|nr:group-specific protein [Erysipelotrichaceae bacterium]
MKFYIGSGMKNCELVNNYAKLLTDNGWEQTYDWVKNVSDDVCLKDMIEYATLESQGIIDSDIVIILLPAGRGAHIELGMAMALNKRVFLCSSTKEGFSIENTVAFYELPKIIKLIGLAEENVKKIIKSKEF